MIVISETVSRRIGHLANLKNHILPNHLPKIAEQNFGGTGHALFVSVRALFKQRQAMKIYRSGKNAVIDKDRNIVPGTHGRLIRAG